MPLTTEMIHHCMHAATSAAYQAGSVIMKHYGNTIEVGSKGKASMGADVVTNVDVAAQERILNVLENVYPELIGVLAEESGYDKDPSRFEKEYFWCIDPIDGTLPFIMQTNGFSVHIGLIARDGSPVLGVVYAPAFDKITQGIVGEGTWIDGRKINIGDVEDGPLYLIYSKHESLPENNNRVLNRIISALKEEPGITKVRVTPYELTSVHQVRFDQMQPFVVLGFPDETGGCGLWDIAASAAFTKASGAWFSDMFGNPIHLNKEGDPYVQRNGILFASHESLAKATVKTFREYWGAVGPKRL